MAELNWSLLQPVDTGAQVQQGFATGMAMVKQVQTSNALKNYLSNPDDPHAFSALSYFSPDQADRIQQQRLVQHKLDTETAHEAVLRGIGAKAATGDNDGARNDALAAGEFDIAKTFGELDADHQKHVLGKYETAAPLAYQMAKLPYEKRRDYINANRDVLKAAGWQDAELDGFDPTDAKLAGIVGIGSKLSELVAADKPQYVPLQPGGGLAQVSGGNVSLAIAPNDGSHPVGSAATGAPATGGGAAGKNNPGGLRKPGSAEFQSFATPAEGIAAQESLLQRRYFGRGLNTVSSIIETYSPRSDNGNERTDNYINYVAKRLGVNPHDVLPPAVVPRLAAVQREWETGHHASTAPATSSHHPDAIREAAQRAIAAGADPAAVRARAAAQGVHI